MDADDPAIASGAATPDLSGLTPDPELIDPDDAEDVGAGPLSSSADRAVSLTQEELEKMHISPRKAAIELEVAANRQVRRQEGHETNDEEELERFRKEWQEEMKRKTKRDDMPKDGSSRSNDGQSSTKTAASASLDTGKPERSPKSTSTDLDIHSAAESGVGGWAEPRSKAEETANKYANFPARRRGRAGRYPVPGALVSSNTDGQGNKDVASFPKTGRVLPKADEGTAPDLAVRLYTRAVESEQSGKLNDALQLYRQAFKLDDSVDRHYALSLKSPAEPALVMRDEPSSLSSADIVSSAAPQDEPYSFQRHIQIQPDYAPPPTAATAAGPSSGDAATAGPSTSPSAPPALLLPPDTPTRPSPLSKLLDTCPIPVNESTFLSADEALPLPIALLPQELADHVFRHLDVGSIERFALTCWRARYLTSNSEVWKRLAESLYKGPPMIPPGPRWVPKQLVRRHRGEWRTLLIEEERVRMDGCYISVCHYIRPGAGDQWVTITHMITYHRFLRFYPDGFCISFLTTDHPSEVVPHLRPSLRGKGLHFGRWHLIRSDHPDNPPAEPSLTGRRRARIVISDLLEPGAESPKYEFEMELHLRETGRGRWNKLDMLSYNSINLGNGETLGLSLKHQKPFYFSKVKSYNPQL